MAIKLYESKAWLVRQRAKGLTPEEIAKVAKCGKTTIYRWMEKHGVK